MKTYEHRVTVDFEETSPVGNVYFVNHLRWQGKCRDQALVRMSPHSIRQTSVELAFNYLKRVDGRDLLAARCEQEIAFMRGGTVRMSPRSYATLFGPTNGQEESCV